MTDKCSAVRPRTGQPCTRNAKYSFTGEGREEPRCPEHAYEWLGGYPPAWVESVVLKGVSRPVHRVVAA
jgi:hypothetical protein